MENVELLEQQAINAAINTKWEEAITLNKLIINQDKENTDAYLRLGFAFLQTSDWEKAEKHYRKALRLQPGNQVAIENIERIEILQNKRGHKNSHGKKIILDPNLFLEIPGKTKSISLVNLGQKNILAHLTVGQEIILILKKRRIEVRTKAKEYIGSLPDDISKRLTIFIQEKSEYLSFIKEANLNKVVVFIKEEKKGRKVQRYTSFPRNIQSNLGSMMQDEDSKEVDEEEEFPENELDRLAEVLTNEDKEFVQPFNHEEEEDEEEE